MYNLPRRMHRFRSSDTIGRWAVVLGLLLVVGPLVQSVTPCRGAAAPDDAVPEAIVTVVVPGAQGACSEAAAATGDQAVSPPRPPFSFDGSFGDGALGLASGGIPAAVSNVQGRTPSPPISPVLDTLRPVVLQI